METAIFYASSTGNTSFVAQEIANELNIKNLYDLSSIDINKIVDYKKIIFGISTWGDGDLQDDWDDIFKEFCKLDFTNKTVALFGLGDQESYADTFVDALGILYEQLKKQNANIVGYWDRVHEYDFDESKAILDDKFVGLVLDEENQNDLTNYRIKEWTTQIKEEIL